MISSAALQAQGFTGRASSVGLDCIGSGITPHLAILRALLSEAREVRIWLLYGERREEDIICRRELDSLALRERRRLSVRYVLSCPPEAQGAWEGGTGRIGSHELREHVPAGRGTVVLVCGTHDFAAATDAILRSDGHTAVHRF